MSKKSNDYWIDRFKAEEEKMHKLGQIEVTGATKEYDRAFNEIQKDISDWYTRIAKNNEISYNDAKKLLNAKELDEFKWSIDEYIKKANENKLNQAWIKELENASAKHHIERLEAMKLQIANQVENLYGERIHDMDNFLKNTFKDSYYNSTFNIAKGTEIGKKIYALNSDLVNTIIHKPWSPDGVNFSERLWKDKNELINNLHADLTQAFIRGESPQKTIARFSKRFDAKKSVASRLILTESAAYQSVARQKCYADLGVSEYQIISTLDLKTSEICQDMDQKVFKLEDYKIGITANPFHPNCRSTTAPYFEDAEDIRVARGDEDANDGKTYEVAADMKYKDWYDKFVVKG